MRKELTGIGLFILMIFAMIGWVYAGIEKVDNNQLRAPAVELLIPASLQVTSIDLRYHYAPELEGWYHLGVSVTGVCLDGIVRTMRKTRIMEDLDMRTMVHGRMATRAVTWLDRTIDFEER